MPDNTISARALASVFPEGPAWEGVESGTMRDQSDSLARAAERDRLEAIKIISDFFPYATELVDEWETTFRLPSGELLTMPQRAKRLAAAWAHISPGSFDGQNEIYALSGFSVHVRPLVPGEDPRVIAASDEPKKTWNTVCGLNTRCGTQTVCGDYTIIPGTIEVRVIGDGRPGPRVKNFLTRCGIDTRCGLQTICGDYSGYNILDPDFVIPDDTWTWSMVYIIEDFSGNFAHVPYQLKNAFDFLTFKIKPNFMWAVVRVEFA